MNAIPITSVEIGADAERAVVEVLRSGLLAQGPVVARFEAEFAERAGVDHAIAVNNGTTALIAALSVLDLEPGDEVVTTPFTFVATLNAVLQAGASVRFADIGADDFNLDPLAVEERLSDRTRVLLPVHLYGQVADMESLDGIARRHDLRLVEDAAQAHFARQGARHAGSWGVGTFSFYATKNITTGEGGMITTSDAEIAARLRLLRNQGMRARYEYEMVGNNFRLTDLQAAIGLGQLDTYDQVVKVRQDNAMRLGHLLADVEWLELPRELPGRRHVWHQYTVVLRPDAPLTREELSERLAAEGVGSGIYYPRLVHDYDCYRSHPGVIVEPTPRAEHVARSCLSLPVHPRLTESDLDRIASAVRGAAG